MTNSDGTITLSTAVDTSGIKKGESQIKGSATRLSSAFARLGGIIAAAFSVRAIKNFLSESKKLYEAQFEAEAKLATIMRQRMNATDKEIKSVLNLASAEQKLGVVGDEVQIAGAQQLATYVNQRKTINKLIPAMNNLLVQQNGVNVSSGSAVGIANLLGKAMMGNASVLRRVGVTFSEEQEKVIKYGNEEQRAAMLAKVITENVGNMNYALAQTDIGRQQQLKNTLGDIKERFGQVVEQLSIAFIPLLQVGLSLLESMANTFTELGKKFADFLGIKQTSDSLKDTVVNLGKASEKTSKQIDKSTTATDKNTVATKKNEKAQKKNAKQVKKTTAHYDKLNVIQKQVTKAAKAAAKAASATTPTITGVTAGAGTYSGANNIEGISKKAKKVLQTIGLVSGVALIGLGLVLLFTGHPIWGISAILAGIIFLRAVKKVALSSSSEQNDINKWLYVIGNITGIALLGLGLILLFTGQTIWGISAIIAGIIALKEVKELPIKGEVWTKDVKQTLGKIGHVAGIALLGLGLILIFVGQTVWGISAIIAGIVALEGVKKLGLEETAFSAETHKKLRKIGDIAGLALLGVGLLLIFIGQLAWGFGAILGGIGALKVSAISAEYDSSIGVKEKKRLQKIGTISGAALLGLGIICLFIPGTQSLGLGMILAGGGVLYESVDWDNLGSTITDRWNNFILPALKIMGKTIANIFIKAINAITSAINSVSKKLNDLFGTELPVYELKTEFDTSDDWGRIEGHAFKQNVEEALINAGIDPQKVWNVKGKKSKKALENVLNAAAAAYQSSDVSSVYKNDEGRYVIYLDDKVIAEGVAKYYNKRDKAKGKKKRG